MATKDIATQRLLTEKEIDDMKQLLNGSLLRPGERILILILLDLAFRSEETNNLLTKLLEKTEKSSEVNVAPVKRAVLAEK